MKAALAAFFCFLLALGSAGQSLDQTSKANPEVCSQCIRKNLEFLASDELRGRGSATEDEHKAAEYIAERLKTYGIQPGHGDSYLQPVTLVRHIITAPPKLSFGAPGPPAKPTIWIHGKEFLATHLAQAEFSGPLMQVEGQQTKTNIRAGAMVMIQGHDRQALQPAIMQAYSAGAAAVLLYATSDQRARFEENAPIPKLPLQFADVPGMSQGGFTILWLSQPAASMLAQVPEGTVLHFSAPTGATEKRYTWNAVGMIRGSDLALQHAAVLFSAHLDHLGVDKPVNGDSIYNGADDDASGTVAVLEIARVLGSGPKPKRTVVFALFGSEELGGLGSTYFREHPPVPLQDIAANLEFEMIGRPDPAVKADTVWLSGWERSNLGPVLAAHGAHLVGDPHPEQDFFARSDNYVLAKKGVVAQTISSYGLHPEYHQPSDDLAHIDFKHMDQAIGSLLAPVEWLVNSDFTPRWNKGGQP